MAAEGPILRELSLAGCARGAARLVWARPPDSSYFGLSFPRATIINYYQLSGSKTTDMYSLTPWLLAA